MVLVWQGILASFAVLMVCTSSQLTKEKMQQLSLKAQKLPNDVCGVSDTIIQKIVGGTKAALGAYPWITAIGYTTDSNDPPSWKCGGSLVTDQFVVTAALCLDQKILRKLKVSVVRLGDLNLDNDVSDGASPVDIEVEKTILHPGYSSALKTNDIGLIKLKTKVQFDNLKKPICLPYPEFFQSPLVNLTTVVIGWGTTEFRGRAQTALNEVSVEIQDTESCNKFYKQVKPETVLDGSVICASSPGKDSCQGDSGGPMMMLKQFNDTAKMYLVGVVFYGRGCASEYPSVYTRVSYYTDWIIDNLEL